MIDTNDKATQPLPLDEQPMKRKRGRPATGTAMTPAEKQRAYRERQKRLRDQNSEHESRKAIDLTRKLEHESREVIDLTRKLEVMKKKVNYWMRRAEEAESKLEQRDQKMNSGNVTAKSGYALQRKSPAGRWRTVATYEKANEANIEMLGITQEMQQFYRIKAVK